MDTSEQVLVIPAAAVTFSGVVRKAPLIREAIEHEGRFEARGACEYDETLRQPVTYVVITRGSAVFTIRYLAGGDPRLDGRLSLGVGGHVNQADGPPAEALAGALRREWDEELEAGFEPSFQPLGYIADNGDAVSRVHVGLLFRVEASGDVRIRETSIHEGEWFERSVLESRRGELTGWGNAVIDLLKIADQTVAGLGARRTPDRVSPSGRP